MKRRIQTSERADSARRGTAKMSALPCLLLCLMITHPATVGAAPPKARKGKPAPTRTAPKKPAARAASAGQALPPSRVEPLSLKAFTQPIPGTRATIEMVPVPGGTFTMADPTKPGATRTVAVKPFFMAKCETRWEQFDPYALQDNNPSAQPGTADAVSKPSRTYIPPDRGYGHDGWPTISVSHNAVTHYCQWLSVLTGKKFRLATEAEWEWACRAGSNQAGPPPAARLELVAWYAGNAGGKTHPVGKKQPNAWGLYDMLGNAAEWCEGVDGKPVVRGGSFKDPAGKVGPTTRQPYTPAWQATDPQIPKSKWWLADGDVVGFRLVCEP